MALTIPIISEFNGKGIDKAIKEFKQLEGAGAKSAFALKKAMVPALAVLGGLAAGLGLATKAAVEDAAAQDQLAGVLERSAMATDTQIAANEKFISSLSRATSTADDELRPALASLVTATGSLELSQSLLTQAQDISASTGTDLATTVDALSKAYNGNMKGLKALDPSITAAIKSGMSFDEIMKTLAATTGGAATDAANTAAGKFKGLKIQMDETKESIGLALLPVLLSLVEIFQPLAYWAGENTRLFVIIVGVIGGFAAAIVAANIALKVYAISTQVATGVTALFNIVIAANPIVLFVAALVAGAAAMVIIEQKTGALSDSFSRFGSVLTQLLGPLYTIVSLLGKLDALRNVRIPNLSGISNFVGGIKIPGFADGGIVTRPTLAMVGEKGPEAIVPLNKSGGMGGVTVNVTGGLSTSAEIGQAVVNAIRAYNRSTGPAQIQVA